MRPKSHFRIAAVLSLAMVLMSMTVASARSPFEFHFKVHNTTKTAIKKILVSQDGKEYGFFDIGNGIPAGATVDLVWDKSTDNENCNQYFKAVFADGEESEAVKFDFCEKDLELEF